MRFRQLVAPRGPSFSQIVINNPVLDRIRFRIDANLSSQTRLIRAMCAYLSEHAVLPTSSPGRCNPPPKTCADMPIRQGWRLGAHVAVQLATCVGEYCFVHVTNNILSCYLRKRRLGRVGRRLIYQTPACRVLAPDSPNGGSWGIRLEGDIKNISTASASMTCQGDAFD